MLGRNAGEARDSNLMRKPESAAVRKTEESVPESGTGRCSQLNSTSRCSPLPSPDECSTCRGDRRGPREALARMAAGERIRPAGGVAPCTRGVHGDLHRAGNLVGPSAGVIAPYGQSPGARQPLELIAVCAPGCAEGGSNPVIPTSVTGSSARDVQRAPAMAPVVVSHHAYLPLAGSRMSRLNFCSSDGTQYTCSSQGRSI